MGVDLLDMAVAFDEEQVVDFFDLDAAADEAKDDFCCAAGVSCP